ncbi:hypothetical protein [Acaryochloris thomasi]|uniref:hypothetical protein n=1 Tax=Acaryochloris thomasi TaxID=2929456 RepID=UPI000DA654E1|nr:hypothetical protein [Acaryochloris thomasi]
MTSGISGLETLHQIRQRYSCLEIPTKMVTARDQSEDIEVPSGIPISQIFTAQDPENSD